MKAHLALGQCEEAEEKKLQISDYEDSLRRYYFPFQYICLMSAQWITPQEARLVCEPIVRKQIMDSVAKAVAPDAFGHTVSYTTIQAMLVPFIGGQSLLLKLDYFQGGVHQTADLAFILLDPNNADTVELPPPRPRVTPLCEGHFGMHSAGDRVGPRRHRAGSRQRRRLPGARPSAACDAIANHLAAHRRPVPVYPAHSAHAWDKFAESLALARDGPPHALAEVAAAGEWDPLPLLHGAPRSSDSGPAGRARPGAEGLCGNRCGDDGGGSSDAQAPPASRCRAELAREDWI
jgi:hypothetical protein